MHSECLPVSLHSLHTNVWTRYPGTGYQGYDLSSARPCEETLVGAEFMPAPTFITRGKFSMLSIHAKIARTQRLLRMLEEDAPLLAVRVAPLTPERQQSAKQYAAQLTAHARAELEKLIEEGSFWDSNDRTPQAAD